MKNTRDSLLGTALAQEIGSPEQTGPCPSPEGIAALVDGSTEVGDRDSILGHLAECGKCRRIFFTARELIDEERAAEERKRYLIPSLLATAATVVIALTLTLTSGEPEKKTTHLAKQEQVAPPTESPSEERLSNAGTEERPTPSPRSVAVPSAQGARRRAPRGGEAQQSPLILLSAEEASMPGHRSFGFASSPQQDGPVITAQNVEIENGTAFPLSIGFSPREGSPVNLATLKLECLKSTPIDLTARISPYAQSDGVRIDRVSLPSGSYRFRVSIGDVNGKFSEREFTVNVGGTF